MKVLETGPFPHTPLLSAFKTLELPQRVHFSPEPGREVFSQHGSLANAPEARRWGEKAGKEIEDKKALVLSGPSSSRVLPHQLLSPVCPRATVARVLVYTKLSASHLVVDPG